MRTNALIFVLSIASVAGLPDLASADPVSEARHFFARGNRRLAPALRMRPGRARDRAVRSALDEYLQSVRIVRSKNALFNVGLCYEELRELESAYGYYDEYLGLDLTDDERAEGERRRANLAPRVALVSVRTEPAGATVYVDRRDLAARGQTPVTVAVGRGERRIIVELEGHDPVERTVEARVGQTERIEVTLAARPMVLEVTSDPPGAEVRIGRKNAPSAGTTPARIEVAAGTHRLYLSRSGYDLTEEVARGTAGQTVSVRVSLVPIPSPGMLRIAASVSGARVEVDGEAWGEATDSSRGVRPGRHRVVVSRAGYQPARTVVAVREGVTTQVTAELEPTDPGRRLAPWPTVALIGGLVAIAGGLGVGAGAIAKQNHLDDAEADFRDAAPGPDREAAADKARDIASDIDSLNQTADIFYIIGAVLGVTWLGLLVLDGPAEQEDSTIRISVGPGGLVAAGVMP